MGAIVSGRFSLGTLEHNSRVKWRLQLSLQLIGFVWREQMPFCDTGQMGDSNSLATLYSLSGRVESAVTKQQTNDCGRSMNKGADDYRHICHGDTVVDL